MYEMATVRARHIQLFSVKMTTSCDSAASHRTGNTALLGRAVSHHDVRRFVLRKTACQKYSPVCEGSVLWRH